MSDKRRIIELQRCNTICRKALMQISQGARLPDVIAESALYETMPLQSKQPLQGLVGHGSRKEFGR